MNYCSTTITRTKSHPTGTRKTHRRCPSRSTFQRKARRNHRTDRTKMYSQCKYIQTTESNDCAYAPLRCTSISIFARFAQEFSSTSTAASPTAATSTSTCTRHPGRRSSTANATNLFLALRGFHIRKL